MRCVSVVRPAKQEISKKQTSWIEKSLRSSRKNVGVFGGPAFGLETDSDKMMRILRIRLEDTGDTLIGVAQPGPAPGCLPKPQDGKPGVAGITRGGSRTNLAVMVRTEDVFIRLFSGLSEDLRTEEDIGLALKAEGTSLTLRIRSEKKTGDERQPFSWKLLADLHHPGP